MEFYRNKYLVEALYHSFFWNKAYYGQCVLEHHIKAKDIKIYKVEKK